MTATSTKSQKDLSPAAIMPQHCDLYYAGRWYSPRAGHYVDTVNPALGETITGVAESDAGDVDAAVSAAHEAFTLWRKIKPLERAAILKEAAAILRAHAEELAMLDALNTGN